MASGEADITADGSGDDTIHCAAGAGTLVGGAGNDGYICLRGDGMNVIIDEPDATGFNELLLAGGITPGDVEVFRTAAADLVLAVGGSEIVLKHFFATAGRGIDRVVFEHDATWSREDLLLRAVDAPAAADFADAPLWPGFDAATDPALPSDWHVEAHTAALF
jgi:Ca2+-binding RTX toxin-like protein